MPPISETQAYKISDGHCFADKQEAYRADILYLYQKLPKFDGQKANPLPFAKFVDSVAAWLDMAKLLQAQMNGEPDADMKRKLATQE